MRRSRRNHKPHRRPLSIIYNQGPWMAINKPAGISVHPGAGKTGGPSVVERLHEEQGEKLHLMHRLDRGTAGVLLLARTIEAAQRGAKEWSRVNKTYWAIVWGHIQPQTVSEPLRLPDGRSQSASTTIEWSTPLQISPRIPTSLCRIRIETGRLHQIRRHLSGLGHPVLLDERYGNFEANKTLKTDLYNAFNEKPKHTFLLCWRLSAPNSSTLPTKLIAPWPVNWGTCLQTCGVSVDDLSRLA
ncbi:MAG: RluA family pseudouridine synthase [Myxococcales bacterium]|nr:RluA family pseudouridine synthase [Myxococcales bacterium]